MLQIRPAGAVESMLEARSRNGWVSWLREAAYPITITTAAIAATRMEARP